MTGTTCLTKLEKKINKNILAGNWTKDYFFFLHFTHNSRQGLCDMAQNSPYKSEYCTPYICRVSTIREKVREKIGRELSGNFEICQGISEFKEKSGNFEITSL